MKRTYTCPNCKLELVPFMFLNQNRLLCTLCGKQFKYPTETPRTEKPIAPNITVSEGDSIAEEEWVEAFMLKTALISAEEEAQDYLNPRVV